MDWLEKRDKLEKMLDFIEERGDDGCEFGEFNATFTDLRHCVEYSGEAFQEAFYIESERIYKYLKENTRIVEEEVTTTRGGKTTTRTISTIEWKDIDY